MFDGPPGATRTLLTGITLQEIKGLSPPSTPPCTGTYFWVRNCLRMLQEIKGLSPPSTPSRSFARHILLSPNELSSLTDHLV
jgi:hypothetical protein